MRKAFADIPPRPELTERWKEATPAERKKMLRELVPEEPAALAIREEIHNHIEETLKDHDAMGAFYLPTKWPAVPAKLSVHRLRKGVKFAHGCGPANHIDACPAAPTTEPPDDSVSSGTRVPHDGDSVPSSLNDDDTLQSAHDESWRDVLCGTFPSCIKRLDVAEDVPDHREKSLPPVVPACVARPVSRK